MQKLHNFGKTIPLRSCTRKMLFWSASQNFEYLMQKLHNFGKTIPLRTHGKCSSEASGTEHFLCLSPQQQFVSDGTHPKIANSYWTLYSVTTGVLHVKGAVSSWISFFFYYTLREISKKTTLHLDISRLLQCLTVSVNKIYCTTL
jgi:hypothetical protein